MSLPPIHELHAFQKVAQQLSFKKAADSLSITPSTLSHLIRSLETKLQTRLFNRTTRSVSLTEEGLLFFKRVNLILEDLKHAVDDLGNDNNAPQGNVRLSVNEVAAPVVLEKLGTGFRHQYPNINIELNVENRFIDIVSEGFDAGVRLRHKIAEDMVAVPIVRNFRFVTVASHHYINKFGKPESPEKLMQHNCIGFRFQSGRSYEWEYRRGTQQVTLDINGNIATNSPSVLCKAAKDGHGIAMIAESLIRKELESKELVILLEDWTIEWPDLELYFPPNRYMPPALRCVINALKSEDSNPN